MTWRGARGPQSPVSTEAQLLAQVRAAARQLGWRFYHPAYSIGSVPGFPDVTLLRPPRLILAELKGPKSQPEPAQREWLASFATLGRAVAAWTDERDGYGRPSVEVYLWRPRDWMDGSIARIMAP
jgi:hypothetical protein